MMRLLRPRFTIRWLMFAVAIVGTGAGAYRIHYLRVQYRKQAMEYADSEEFYRGYAEMPFLYGCGLVTAGMTPEEKRKRTEEIRAKYKPLIEYYAEMHLKYEHAARYPWLVVAPDPPVPD